MAKNLVIVESPAKAKTIEKFLGKEYKVLASMGHVRDLPKSKMGVDVKKGFKPSYGVLPDKKKVITNIKSKIKEGTIVWVATDEDREGEAIGWHLLEALKIKDSDANVHRIVFHEITKGALLKAIDNPRKINQDVVDAQQARRVLDRLVGYELSPLLWKKVRYGLSAGRVQSVAVRLIVDKERLIQAFKPDEYWKITNTFSKQKDKKIFEALLDRYEGKKIKVVKEKEAKKVLKDLEGAEYIVDKVEKHEVKRNPAAPFITSTLQQEASRKLHYSVKQTMMFAQQLYEGIDMGDKGHKGLITYMRTDSVNMAATAVKEAKKVIESEFGKEYALSFPRSYKSKKGAQEAHEAIRPVEFSLKPADIEGFLTKDQFKLYDLIWKRALATQMAEAKLDRVGADIVANGYSFRATGQTIKFPGFMRVYVEGSDNPDAELENKEKLLPELIKGEKVDLQKIDPTQHFTKPPARYTEASLVKKLEEEGIGRPSTYAPTISTVIARGYVEKEQRQLRPTDVAEVVTDLLVEHFADIVDYHFTAEMEEELDKIEEGKRDWKLVMKNFYGPFHKNLEIKDKSIKKEDVVNEESDEKCDKCGSGMVIKLGRFGKFLSCSNYPECKNAKPLPGEEDKRNQGSDKDLAELEKKLGGKECSKCGKPMEVKVGRFGPFLACTSYPDCKNIESIVKSTGVKCPKCETGELIERRTRKGGKLFWGCNKFPKCKFASWDKPLTKKCKKCHGMMVEKKEEEVCVDCDADKK